MAFLIFRHFLLNKSYGCIFSPLFQLETLVRFFLFEDLSKNSFFLIKTFVLKDISKF